MPCGLTVGGAPSKSILRYLCEVSGKIIRPKDVQYMIADMRAKAYTFEDVNKRVQDVLQVLCEEPGNVAATYRSADANTTSCITFQTAHMWRMLRRFPGVLCVDATYGTNTNKYV